MAHITSFKVKVKESVFTVFSSNFIVEFSFYVFIHESPKTHQPQHCLFGCFVIQTAQKNLLPCTVDYVDLVLLLIDIDECVQELDDCDKAVTECINSPGSYICSCYKQNYVWNGETCVGKEHTIQITQFLFSFKRFVFTATSFLTQILYLIVELPKINVHKTKPSKRFS